MASITKRGKTWQYTVSHMIDGNYRPIRKSGFKTKKEAILAAAEVEMNLKKGIQVISKDKSFAEYFKEWIDLYKKSKHKNTYSRYLRSLSTVENYFGDTPIQKIKRIDYQKFLNTYANGHAIATVRKLNIHVRSCVQDAIEAGYISIDFTRKAVIYGTEPTKKPSEKHIDYEESKKLYNALFEKLNPRYLSYYLILLGLVSGARYGELVGLTKDDFDFDTNRIDINKSWDYQHGTGFAETKNEHSIRKVTIDPRVMKVFKDLFDFQGETPYNLVFHSPGKIGVTSNKGANKSLENILTSLDIEKITVHGLRHTHASVLLYQGCSIQYVSERLGHSDIDTTLSYYTHVLKELKEKDEKQAADIFSNMKED